MLYLDYAATTPLCKEVLETYTKILAEHFGNADSLHRLGAEVDHLMNQSRELLARMLSCQPSELIFTSGASEANNLAVKGCAFYYQNRGRHLITTAMEHSSVYETFLQLRDDFGFEVSFIDLNKDGTVNLESLKKELRPDTTLVSCMLVNNEVGIIQPVAKIAEILKSYPLAHFHVDMVQAFGKIPVSLEGVDLATFSAHKIYGLKGSGLLFKRASTRLKPQICGGQQESGLRAGTSNVPVNIVFAKTARLALEHLNEKYDHAVKLNQRLRAYFEDKAVINSPLEASPYILNVSLPDYQPEVILHALEQREIYISTKSACSTKQKTMGHTLKAMGVSEPVGNAALRISLSHLTSMADIEYFTATFDEILKTVKKRGHYEI